MKMGLNKTEKAEYDRLLAALRETRAAANVQIGEVNAALEKHVQDMESAVNDYNTVIDELTNFVDAIKEDRRAYIDEKSDAWKESDKGEEWESFVSEWEEFDAEAVEVTAPEPLDMIDESLIDAFNALSVEGS